MRRGRIDLLIEASQIYQIFTEAKLEAAINCIPPSTCIPPSAAALDSVSDSSITSIGVATKGTNVKLKASSFVLGRLDDIIDLENHLAHLKEE